MQPPFGAYEQELANSRRIGDRHKEASLLRSLGRAYIEIRDFKRAVDYYEQSVSKFHQINDQLEEAQSHCFIGMALSMQGNFRGAINSFEQYLVISRKVGARKNEETALGNIGAVHEQLGDISQAVRYFEQALTIAREINNHESMAFDSFKLANFYNQQGNFTDALSLATDASRMLTLLGSPNAQQAQQLVVKLKSKLPQADPSQAFREAFHAFQYSTNLQAMQSAVLQYPILRDPEYIQFVEEHFIPPESKTNFASRLSWLKQIVGKR